MKRWRVLALAVLALAGCASLGPRTEGVAGPIRYRATDLEVARRTVNDRDFWFYSFSVHVTELQGRELVFNEIETTVYQPGTGAWSPVYRGLWKLRAHGEFRIPLTSSLGCHSSFGSCAGPSVPIPLWRITLTGTDDRDLPVRIVIDLTLPPDPPPVPVATSKSVPPIDLRRPTPAVR